MSEKFLARRGTILLQCGTPNVRRSFHCQYADLELFLEDRVLSKKHVNLDQAVMFYRPNSQQVPVMG